MAEQSLNVLLKTFSNFKIKMKLIYVYTFSSVVAMRGHSGFPHLSSASCLTFRGNCRLQKTHLVRHKIVIKFGFI